MQTRLSPCDRHRGVTRATGTLPYSAPLRIMGGMKFHNLFALLALLLGSCASVGTTASSPSMEMVWVVEATGGA